MKIKNVRFRSWYVCMVGSLFFFYEFMQMNMFNAINPDIMMAFDLRATQLGDLFAYYFYANVLCLLPAGVLLDRVSTRTMMLSAMVVCVFSLLWFALASALWHLKAARFLCGMGSSFCFLSCMRLASRWFPKERLALVMGLVVTMGMLGGVLAQVPLTTLVMSVGWRMALVVNACMGVLIGVAIACVVRDYPDEATLDREQQCREARQESPIKTAFAVLSTVSTTCAGMYTCLMNLPVLLLGGAWGGLYLVSVHQVTRVEAVQITTMLFVGTILGSPCFGFFSDRWRKRVMPMLFGALLSLVCMMLVMFWHGLGFWVLWGLFGLLGFFTSAQVLTYPLVSETHKPTHTSAALGWTAVLVMMGGVIFPPLFGYLVDLRWAGTQVGGVSIYEPSDFTWAASLMLFGFLGALLSLLGMKKRKTF